MAGVALTALGQLWWRTGFPNDAVDAAALCVAGVALGDIDCHFAWQAWHLVTWTFTWRGRRGTWRHVSSLCVAGVPRMALGWLRWRAWAGVERGDVGALGDIHLRITWQAWYSVTSTSTSLCLSFLPGMDDYRPQGMQKEFAKFAVA